MGWSHVPDVDSTLAISEDNPFAAPKQQPAGKISVQLPTDDWLCRKMDRLNLTLTQGYPSKGSDAGGLQRDWFIKASKSQWKWYGLHPNQNKPTGSVSFWHCDTAKLNSTYSRIARSSGLTTPAPPSGYISQDNLRKWEKSAREATYMCNQAAGFSRCLSKVQQGLSSQLKIIQAEHSKGKSADKVGSATEELQYLLHFNSSISQCMAKTMEHLSDFAFVSMYNCTLIRRDSYLAHVKAGIKQDTLAALRQAVNLNAVFHVPIATGLPQKKGISPVIVNQNKVQSLKPVNNASCVDHYVHPPVGWTYYFCFFRHPVSGIPLGFQTF